MKLIKRVKDQLTQVHLWVGELLGLTHYRNCWDCVHSKAVEPPLYSGQIAAAAKLNKSVCNCMIDDGGYPAFCDPSEAVWCAYYTELTLTDVEERLQEQYEKEEM